jgi:hypothetical protein
MAFKRAYSKKRKMARKSRVSNKRRKVSSFASRVKKIVLRASEPKRREFNIGLAQLNHNVVANWRVNDSSYMPPQGTTDITRVGDHINTSTIRLRIMLGQKSDRPNVTFKWWVLRVPKGSTYGYTTWFTATSGNALLDDINMDFCKIVKSGIIKMPNYAGNATIAKENTMIKTIIVPYKRLLKFGPADGAVTHNDDDLHFCIVAYDAYGTLVADNIAYIQFYTDINFKDL